MHTDAELQERVINELRWDPNVDVAAIGVEVAEGVVTLTGVVRSFAEVLAAEEAVHRVSGVLDVANNLEVKQPDAGAPSDTEIAQAVRRVLEWHVHIPHERIHSTVTSGIVSLEGAVPYLSQREEAARLVLNLVGVRGVANRIAVEGPLIKPATVRRAIVGALERRADREAERIQVTVHDGTVRLSGHVHSWQEKQAVLGAARSTGGVRKVEDALQITLNE